MAARTAEVVRRDEVEDGRRLIQQENTFLELVVDFELATGVSCDYDEAEKGIWGERAMLLKSGHQKHCECQRTKAWHHNEEALRRNKTVQLTCGLRSRTNGRLEKET